MGPGSPSRISARRQVHLWDLAAGTLITHPGPRRRQLRRVHPGREAAGGAGVRRQRPPRRRADRRRGAGAPRLRPAPRLGRLHAPDGLQPRRLHVSPPNATDSYLNLWDLGPASGLAVEPEADDVAGWLRRSRALAEQGDAAGAEAAYARARDIKGGDASPWIEHAVWLYRRGDSVKGTGRPGPGHGVRCPTTPGDGSTSAGCSDASAGRRSQRRSWRRPGPLCERRLSRVPDDEAAAAALAELLPEADAAEGWTSLRPDVMIPRRAPRRAGYPTARSWPAGRDRTYGRSRPTPDETA